ncbi:hypothetical protein AK36_6086 (plasmid) [Burkholderia vietnamiensis LMG 10929]|nr:hypothetical protein AK36_6086 [Burkholderia vietnamiensis LMG 10929]
MRVHADPLDRRWRVIKEVDGECKHREGEGREKGPLVLRKHVKNGDGQCEAHPSHTWKQSTCAGYWIAPPKYP